jgi:MFS transporter, PAT family, beta-lactamase induction signal transducer AmpG
MASKRTPPVWVMGLSNLPLGVTGAVALLIVPQLLAAAHVPEPRIAEITGLALLAGFGCVPVSPILDVRFSRKTYTIGFILLSGLLAAVSLLEIDHLAVLGWLLFATLFSVSLAVAAAGGWLGSLVAKTDDTRLGSWLTVANIAGFGLTAIVGAGLIRALPPGLGAVALGLIAAAPALVCAMIPGPPPDRRLARESFGQFFRDLAALVRRPSVLLTVLLFAVPAASFALTNTLGGLGHDYSASEQFVSLAGGAGVTVAGVIGSLLVPRLADRISPRALYLGIGTVGGLFTLSLIVLPHTRGVFLLAMGGENIAQSAALATANVVIFRTMGKDNPFAATEFAILTAAVTVPITYMQVIDGHAYGAGGLAGTYMTDAGLGLAACAAMAVVLMLTRRRFETAPA